MPDFHPATIDKLNGVQFRVMSDHQVTIPDYRDPFSGYIVHRKKADYRKTKVRVDDIPSRRFGAIEIF
jgi:hypothetical protein